MSNRSKHRQIRWQFVLFIVWALTSDPLHAVDDADKKTPEEIVPLIQKYCGACHKVPSPAILPRRSWPRVIDAMVELAGKAFIPESDLRHIKALYYGSSPEELPRLPYIDQPHPLLEFKPSEIGEGTPIPQILCLQSVDLGREASLQLLVCDGERRALVLLEADEKLRWRETVVTNVDIPIKALFVDFDGDGSREILVADLGELTPSGVLAGKIFVLQPDEKGNFEKQLLISGLGRVSDINALDLDQDGDLDLAVAVFGGAGVGEVFWMENRGVQGFKKHGLLPLSGALNVSPADLNGDGKIDLVSLVAQEHEAIFAFINLGKGGFKRIDIAKAPHPMFGSTSMLVTDLDRDGDPDMVFTNGDAFDTQTDPKPYHGVQWMENKGNLQFAYRDIGRFYGAANAAVGDIDNDGDLDILVSSWANYWEDERRQSLVWFENNGRQQFQARPASSDFNGLVPLELVDVTGDGRLDVITGAFRMDILKDYLIRDGDRISLDYEAMQSANRQSPDKRRVSPRLLLFRNEAIVRKETIN